jgi:hypothetical protein
MNQCSQCGRYAEDLWVLSDEFGKSEFACNDCVPQPPTREVAKGQKPRCPVCGSANFVAASQRYWFSRVGGLFHCERRHLFTVRKVSKIRTITEEVWIPDD